MPVLLVGTLDTKGAEFAFVRDLLRRPACACLVLDAGVLGPPAVRARHPARGGLRRRRHQPRRRPRRPPTAARPSPPPPRARAVSPDACTPRARSTASSAWAARPARPSAPPPCARCPFGVPKLMVSTLASGAGAALRRRPRRDDDVLRRGHQRAEPHQPGGPGQRRRRDDRHGPGGQRVRGQRSETTSRSSTATMFGVTTPCVEAARRSWRRRATRCWSSTPPAPAGRRWRRSSATG